MPRTSSASAGNRPLALLLVVITAGLTGCARRPTLAIFPNEQAGFTIAYPSGWKIVRADDDKRFWFLPPDAPAGNEEPHLVTPEFLLVFTLQETGPLTDDQARRLGLSLLPIHGVSGFRRFKDEEGRAWHRFEVTGTSGPTEWASVGLLVVGSPRTYYVVCAKPLPRWREGQKECDEILKTFRVEPP